MNNVCKSSCEKDLISVYKNQLKNFKRKEKMNSKQADELKVNYHTMSFFSKIISKFL
jgi:hypothetical protein